MSRPRFAHPAPRSINIFLSALLALAVAACVPQTSPTAVSPAPPASDPTAGLATPTAVDAQPATTATASLAPTPTATLEPTTISPTLPPSDPFLERQALAMRPAFQGDLDTLADAPRYTIEAIVDLQERTVDGRLTLDYTNTAGLPLAELAFRLFPNANTIYGGGSLTVDSITIDGESINFELSDDRTVMRVPLEASLAAGQAISVSMAFVARVPANTQQGYGIFNQAGGVTSLAGWYPILAPYQNGWQTPPVPAVGDALVAEISLYDVRLTVPADVTVVSTGSVVDKQVAGEMEAWHVVSGPAREFAVAISDRFERRQTEVDGVTVSYYALPAVDPTNSIDTAFGMTADAFAVYVDRFGPYPYREMDAVEAVTPIGGYEFSGMVYIDHGFRVGRSLADLRYIVGHEVAHQWWYGLVGNDSVREPWLDESLVSYAADIYLEQAVSGAAARELLESWKRTYGLRSPSDPPVDSSALRFSGWPAYRSATYYHGALFLHALREEIGGEKFFALLRRYQAMYRYRIVTTADFLGLAEEVAGTDLNPLFDRWFGSE